MDKKNKKNPNICCVTVIASLTTHREIAIDGPSLGRVTNPLIANLPHIVRSLRRELPLPCEPNHVTSFRLHRELPPRGETPRGESLPCSSPKRCVIVRIMIRDSVIIFFL